MNSEIVSAIISIICLVVGLLGTFLPVLPGLLLSFVGLLFYKYGTDSDLSTGYIIVFGVLTLVSMLLDYIIPAKTAKKYGGTRWGSIGSFVGTILGLFFIPLPFGFLIGMLIGVLLGELIHDGRNFEKAINAVKGALIGFIYSTGFSFLVAMTMLIIVLWDMIW